MKLILLPSASRFGAFGPVADAFMAATPPDLGENAKIAGLEAMFS
ncbi:hypothetical protein [Kaistia algarum]|nr:hypothetical protein [Kaistia algarum]MCX5512599.1 hypothetical protein [Kaistia algarum]